MAAASMQYETASHARRRDISGHRKALKTLEPPLSQAHDHSEPGSLAA